MSDAPLSEDEYRAELARTMTEDQLLNAVMGAMRLLGWRVAHFSDSRRVGPRGQLVGDWKAAGFPDLCAVHPTQARVLFAELKREKGKVKPAQQAWLDDLAAVDAEVYLWRPIDWHTGRIEAILRGDDERDCGG